MVNGTMRSFTRAFKKEINANPHLKEANEFGQMVVNFASQIEVEENSRNLVNRLVGEALKILPLLYRASTLDYEYETNAILRDHGCEEALAKIQKCRQILQELGPRIGRLISLKKITGKLTILEKKVSDWIEEMKTGEDF